MPRPKKTAKTLRQKTVSFRLPDALMQRFRRLALANHRTLSGEVQLALENHLDNHRQIIGAPPAKGG
jgi:predicted DNA-binding protein